MTNNTEKLHQARKDYLNGLTTQSDTAQLRQQLAVLAAVHPDLFVSYAHNAGVEPIDTNTANWSKDYFSRQKVYAGSNFSRTRVEHLIDLRAHLSTSPPQREPQKPAPSMHAARAGIDAGFTPSPNLGKFVERGDLPTVRTALRMELNNKGLDAAALKSSVRWTKERIPGLFEPFQEKAFARGINADSAQWEGDYFGTQVVYLTTNFSEERFLHLIEVREHNRRRPASAPAPDAGRPARPAPQPAPAPAPQSEAPRGAPQAARHATPHAKGGMSPLHPVVLLVGGAIVGIATIIYIVRKYT